MQIICSEEDKNMIDIFYRRPWCEECSIFAVYRLLNLDDRFICNHLL